VCMYVCNKTHTHTHAHHTNILSKIHSPMMLVPPYVWAPAHSLPQNTHLTERSQIPCRCQRPNRPRPNCRRLHWQRLRARCCRRPGAQRRCDVPVLSLVRAKSSQSPSCMCVCVCVRVGVCMHKISVSAWRAVSGIYAIHIRHTYKTYVQNT